MRRAFCRLIGDRSGVTAIEYALLAALISVTIIVAAGLTGTTLNQTFHVIHRAIVDPS
jgi:pilus assembly protein Flp/PilA